MKSKTWYTQGKKPDRVIKGVLAGALEGFLDAVANKDTKPWVRIVSRAVGSGTAMAEHRLANRADANRRNKVFADQLGGVVTKTLELVEAARPAAVPQPTPYFAAVVGVWNEATTVTRMSPGQVEIPIAWWTQMTEGERQALVNCSTRDGVRLVVGLFSTAVARPRLLLPA